MSRYLKELYKKSDHYKKRFALLASSTITLFIFGVWSLTVFGIGGQEVAVNTGTPNTLDGTSEVSPLQSIRMNLASSFEAVRNSFEGLKSGLEEINLEEEYQKLRDESLNTYGQ